MFRILNLRLYNFKGFRDVVIPFEKPRVILGGPNGYGKTSIFDALELLFTGKIERMQVYKPNHDARSPLNDDYKPLVCDTSVEDIIVEADVQVTEQNQVRLRRSAKQQRMKNPVDFEAFSALQYLDAESGEYRDVSSNVDLRNLCTTLEKQYQFLNYLTQEEANSFLKCKEQDRKQQINSLFKTEGFDEPIKKLTDVRADVTSLAQTLQNEITQLKQDVERLQSIQAHQGAAEPNAAEYVRFFESEIDWDTENPQLSYEGFNTVLREGGILDDLHYYCVNADNYRWYDINERLKRIQQPDSLSKIAIWLKWKDSDELLAQYADYQNTFRKATESLTISTLRDYHLSIPTLLPEGLIPSELIQDLNHQLTVLHETAKSAGTLQSAYADMAGAREVTERTLLDVEDAIHIDTCPLCGQKYESEKALIQTVQEFGKQFNAAIENITQGVSFSIRQFVEQVRGKVINTIDGYYNSIGLDADVMRIYQTLNKVQMKETCQLLDWLLFPMQIDSKLTKEEIASKINTDIESWRQKNVRELPEDFDVLRLQKVQSSFGRSLKEGALTTANLEKKRQYLSALWNATTSQLLAEKTAQMTLLTARHARLTTRSKLIKKTIDTIKEQKNAYLSKMVSQIETLFYIYTGRIMQDNFYGRGCFLNYKQSNSVVLFTSGSYNNEVDAIYKMSSGQLVSISVAFMLTLNKLYANHPFIAIDDPVQTIDDLNLWGFMETLRHDFKDSGVLLSTHERNFGMLLTDKFNKSGLETEYLDMSRLH